MPFPAVKCGRAGAECAPRQGRSPAGPAEGRFGPGGVVPGDEGTRDCGEWSTTPEQRKAGSGSGAWCPSTKE